ncbi:MAG: hypothetical protein WC712_15020 [Candidatus Brocadiia bacterium]
MIEIRECLEGDIEGAKLIAEGAISPIGIPLTDVYMEKELQTAKLDTPLTPTD